MEKSIFTFIISLQILLIGANEKSFAQNSNKSPFFGQKKIIILLDQNNIPETDIPFDRWFYLKKDVSNTDSTTRIIATLTLDEKPDKLKTNINSEDGKKFLYILVPNLEPHKTYKLEINGYKTFDNKKLNNFLQIFKDLCKNDTTSAKMKLQMINSTLPSMSYIGYGEILLFHTQIIKAGTNNCKCLTEESDISSQCQKDLAELLVTKTISYKLKADGKEVRILLFRTPTHYTNIGLTTIIPESFSFDTRTSLTIFPNFGYVYYGFKNNFNGATPFWGLTFNFRYIDRDIPLKRVFRRFDSRRIGLTLGITTASIAKEPFRNDFLTNKTSLLGGLEYRITHAVKFSAGYILYWKQNANPLLIDQKLGYQPFIGISLDLKLEQTLSDIGNIFSTNFINVPRK